VSLRRRSAGIGIVLGVVLLQLLAYYIANRDAGRFFSVLLLFAMEMPPLILTLNALFHRARHLERSSGWLVIVGLLVAGAIGGVFGGVLYVLSESVPSLGLHTSSVHPMTFVRSVLFGATQAQSHFGLWTLAFVLPIALEDARVRTLEAQQLRSAAELSRLRANLEPHFLLNTLNAIAGLVTEDPRESRRLLAALGDLLRDALADEGELQTLGAQMTWLRRYGEILEARHRGDLTFEWDIATGLDDLLLPRLLIQPLVENAVKHGALKRETKGRILVRVTRVGTSRVRCIVEDDGPGLDDAPVRSGAFGIESVKRRLELRYGAAATLSLEAANPGTRAIVEFPGATHE
jgi:sensor histidine kinase YesM